MAKKRHTKRRGRKALARRITRERGLSYDRMSPNKRGVTALSEINGRGAYAERYARTRALLDGEDGMAKANGWRGKVYRKQVSQGRTPAQARATVRMLEAKHSGTSGTRRARPNGSKQAHKDAYRGKTRSRSGTKRRRPKAVAYRANLRRSGKRILKRDYVAEQMRKGRTKKQAEQDWRLASGYYTDKRKKQRKKPRTYGKGKYKALKARVGSGKATKTRQTYFYRTKKGNIRKIPDHAILGYGSAAEMNEVYRSGTERERARLSQRLQALYERRERAAERAAGRARRGTAWFSPNAGEQILNFEEWQQMKRNARKSNKRRAKKNKRRSTPKRDSKGRFVSKSRSTRRKTSSKRKSRSRKPSRATVDSAIAELMVLADEVDEGKGRSSRRRRRKTSSKRRSKRSKRTPRRDSKGRFVSKGRSTRRRKASSKRSSKRRSSKKVGFAKMSKARRCEIARKGGRATARKTRKRRPCDPKRMRRNAIGTYAKKKKATKKKSYKRNATGAAFKMELKNAFKYGLIVTGGYLGHRVLTNLADKYVVSKIKALSEGSMAPYRKLITGGVVAAVGIPLTVRALPKHAGVAAAGMAASLLHGLIVTALGKAEQPELLEAVSAYPDAPGYAQYSGVGSYYEYQPHQVFDGYGEFYETQPIPGLEQAAANGYGAADGQMLAQAAAGFNGELTQMYANPMGEYYAYGAEGIGEYESAPHVSGGGGYTDDGIQPNLHSAEQMLDVAEAAAGFGDMPLQSTVEPMIRAMDIPDQPGGSRAGILAGGDGIFG